MPDMPAEPQRSPSVATGAALAEPPASPPAARPPRRRGALRQIAYLWWKLFTLIFLGNYVPGGVIAAVQGGWTAFVAYATSWGLIAPLERANPLAFWVGAGALAALAVVGAAAEVEEKRVARAEAAIQRGQAAAAHALAGQAHEAASEAREQAGAAHETAQTAAAGVADVQARVGALEQGRQLGEGTAPEPQGPPFDDGLLPAPDHFVGRGDDLAWVLDRLRPGSATAITALGGMGGIGKTALAAEAVRALKAEGRFPDGIAVVLCQGRTDALGLLRDVLTRFDPRRRQPEAEDAAGLAETAHALLDGKRALVVLDNVEPGWPVERVVGPLRAAGAAVLITARQHLAPAAVPADGSRALDVLPEDEALDLFAQALGRPDAAALAPGEREAALRIVRALDRHTLAVKLAGASAARTHRDLGALAGELENPRQALRLPEGDAPAAVEHAFASSYEQLPADARRLFAGLASFATPEFGRASARALGAGIGLTDPAASLDTLVTRALLDAQVNESLPADSDRERLRLHALLRAFAAAEQNHWSEAERDAAQRAIADHYAAYARGTTNAARSADEANIAGALEWAHAHGQDQLVADLCTGMQYFWRDTGRTAASLTYLPWGVAAAEKLLGARPGDDADSAAVTAWTKRADTLFWLLLNDGYAFQATGRLDAAAQRYERCLTLARNAGLRRDEGAALSSLGQVAAARGRLDDAEAYYQQALAVLREVQDRQGEGVVLSTLGQVAQRRGRLEAAEAYYQQSLAIRREVQDRQGEGVDLAQLGLIAESREQFDKAETYYRQCLQVMRDVQDAPNEAAISLILGTFLVEHRDNREEGCPLVLRAVAIRHELGLPGEEDARATARRLGCA